MQRAALPDHGSAHWLGGWRAGLCHPAEGAVSAHRMIPETSACTFRWRIHYKPSASPQPSLANPSIKSRCVGLWFRNGLGSPSGVYMKHTITASIFAVGLVGASGGIAQDQSQTADLQNITVTAPAGQYETYAIDLNTGFGLKVLVGNRHGQYMEARRATERLENLRKQGMAQAPFVNVAIDNSSGEGHAWQILLSDHAQRTLAIVDVYCGHFARDGGKRCLLVPLSVPGSLGNQVAASSETRDALLAQVQAGSR